MNLNFIPRDGKENNKSETGLPLQMCKQLFCTICKATGKSNTIYSLPVLFVVTTKLVTAASSVFIIIQRVIRPDLRMGTIAYIMTASFIFDWLYICIIFLSADLPTDQVLIINIRNMIN